MKQKKRLDLVVISDVHLGSYGCYSRELVSYLKSINPKTLVLNGDLLDIWRFKKYYWPESHMAVLKQLLGMLSNGTTIYYLTGNHDEMLRKFSPFRLGNFHLVDKLVLNVDAKKVWIFHGDIFDITMKYTKFLAKLGGKGYDFLILLNKTINYITMRAGYGRRSFSRRIKDSVKSAVKYISHFEETATDLAIENGYDYVVCGHIHRPQIKTFSNGKGEVTYLNSGDWVENLTALEYHNQTWRLFRYPLTNQTGVSTGLPIETQSTKNEQTDSSVISELLGPDDLTQKYDDSLQKDEFHSYNFAKFDHELLQGVLNNIRVNGKDGEL